MSRIWMTAILTAVAAVLAAADQWKLCSAVLAVIVVFSVTMEEENDRAN